MNQILSTKLKNIKLSRLQIMKKIALYKLQFALSILFFLVLILFFIYQLHSLNSKENVSQKIIDSYSVYQLYSEKSSKTDNNTNNDVLFGIIEIPSIQVYYPVFSTLNDELLKISPCKFYGTSPSENGNICIAGHNYNNSLFFSNIVLLKQYDIINIYDNLGNKYVYFVFNNYEVTDSDLSPILNFENNSKELTLVTCNNINGNRIIIKAKQKDF